MKSLAAHKLRRYRKARKPRITQEELGRRYGVTGPAVHHWEIGERTPGATTIRKMADDGIAEPGDWFVAAPVDGECSGVEAAE